jgi:predicted amidohydrolase YtcJ
MTPDDFEHEVKIALSLIRRSDDSTWNKAVYALGKRLHSVANAGVKRAVKEAKAANTTASGASSVDYPDDFTGFTPEQRSAEVAKLLDWKLQTKELTASELRELKDIFNLKSADQDIHIEQVDFTSIEPELADIVAAVSWQITDFNKDK